MLFTNRFFSPKQNNSALKKNRNPVGFNKGHPCGVSGTAQQPCNVILGLAYRQWLETCCVRPELLFFSSNRFLKVSADQEMSRAGIRFLRMLLPSGNSRVSVTLNRLIRALFRRGFFRVLFRRGFFPCALSQGLLPCDISRRLFLCAVSPGLFPCAFSSGLSPCALSQGLFSVRSFAGTFTVRYFAEAFSVHSFVGAFPVASFAGALSVHSFTGALPVHSFVGAFSVCSFAGPFPVRSFAGAFSVRCVAGAFSVRSFKLEFRHIASFEWIDMLDASFLKLFSISARVLGQFWASLRGIQHIRDWINWNWNHQKKRPEAWHRIKSYQKRIIRFNQILLQFFLHNCLENQIPFKQMTNMSMMRNKRSLRYNVIYQPFFFTQAE